MNQLLFLEIGLAVYFLSWYIVYEDGPGKFIQRFRWAMGVNVQELRGDEIVFVSNGTLLADILSCPYCFSFYMAVLVCIPFWFTGDAGVMTLLSALGVSTLLFGLTT